MKVETYDDFGKVEGIVVYNDVSDDEIVSYVNPEYLADAAERLADEGVTQAELLIGHPEDTPESAPNVPMVGLKARDGSLGTLLAPQCPRDHVFEEEEGGE